MLNILYNIIQYCPRMKSKPTHRPEMFEKYITYDGPEGEGFRISQNEDSQEIYIFDDYGGWVDRELNYYNSDGEPAGYFDQDFNFYDMYGSRIPGGYKGGKTVEKRIRDKQKFLDSINDKERQKFVVEISNLPKSTNPSQIVQYIIERCDIRQEQIEESKKVQKDASKGYVVVTGVDAAQKLLILEGRKFRIREKDGSYVSNEIQIFVRESKYNRPNEQNGGKKPMQDEIYQDNQKFMLQIDGLDASKQLEDLQRWLCESAMCEKSDISAEFKKGSAKISLEDEDLMYRILKLNGKSFGDKKLFIKKV